MNEAAGTFGVESCFIVLSRKAPVCIDAGARVSHELAVRARCLMRKHHACVRPHGFDLMVVEATTHRLLGYTIGFVHMILT